jgi:hypothetical protein
MQLASWPLVEVTLLISLTLISCDKKSIGGYEPSRNRVVDVVPARQVTQPGGICSLESILGLLKSLKKFGLGFNKDNSILNCLPEAKFLDEIQTKSEEFTSLLLTVTSTALP